MADDSSQIWIVTEVETSEAVEIRRGERSGEDVGGGFGSKYSEQVTTIVRKRVPLDAIALKSQMNGLLKVVGDLFEQAEQQPSDMVLDEMKLVVEINAEGQVSIMGNGGKLGDRGTIELKFKRMPIG